MFFSLLIIYFTAYFTAFKGLDILADIFGGSALTVWLITIAAGGISAFMIRKRLWKAELSTAIILLILYSVVSGILFSVFFLGDDILIGIIIVAVIFILSALYNSVQALKMKDSVSAGVKWSLSVYVGVLITISLWVLIWGAWDTTKRKYSRTRK